MQAIILDRPGWAQLTLRRIRRKMIRTNRSQAMITKTRATIEDLYKVDGKAELVNGEIVHMSPTGARPSFAARAIVFALYEYEKRTQSGYAVTDNAGFTVNLPHRKSFCPDAAFY